MAAKKAKKPKMLGPAQKKKIWKSFQQLELKIQKHKKLLALLSITHGDHN
jgi:hypothetical protein